MYLKAFSLLDKKNKRRVYIIFFLMILAGGVEALGLGLIIPLVKMLIDQNFLINLSYQKYLFNILYLLSV